MNMTKASCGHDVWAVGAPGSQARRAVESRPCPEPRCRSGLPKPKFTDQECAAWCWVKDRQMKGWAVDMLNKKVHNWKGKEWANLVEFARDFGWDG